ncbi:MAG: replicative DNA helicase [Proteobacteria bacterium]|nr:replicative DNA helicase [Pseudomonadota bacterium]
MSPPDERRVGNKSTSAGAEGRVPPYSQEAEAAVLGGILLNNEALPLIQDAIKPEDFYVEVHRRIYEAIEGLSLASLPVDHVTLGNELKNRGDLEKIGGAVALANLTDSVATIANIEYYAGIVKEKAAVRRMIYATQEVTARGFSDYGDAAEFLDAAEAAVFKASQQHIGSPFYHISQIVKKTFTDIELAAGNTGEVTGVPSGFISLDKKTAGFQKSDLIIVAGRPAMGKTSLALNIAVNAAVETKRPAIVFSLEMSKNQLVRRMLSSEGRIDASRIRGNKLEKDDWPRLIQAANDLSQTEIYLDDSAPMTPLEIRAKSRRLMAEKGLSLIVIDYLQLMRAGGKRMDNREQEISEISRSLKGLAKELNVPVIALSQLNRGVESRPDKRPMMSDLRESGAIEQDADLILFVYRDEVYNKETDSEGIAEIIIGKQRSGPVGTVELRFSREFTRFDNLVRGPEQPGTAPGNHSDY